MTDPVGFGCLIALHRSSSFLQSKFPPALQLGHGEGWPRLNVERSRVAGDPRGPGSVRPFRPRRRWGIGAQARSRRHHRPLDGCIVTDVALCSVAGFRVDVVPGSRLSTRSTRSRRRMGLRGAGLPMFVARSRRAADTPAEWPRPRPRQGRPGRPEDGRNTEPFKSAQGPLQRNNRPVAALRGVPRAWG